MQLALPHEPLDPMRRVVPGTGLSPVVFVGLVLFSSALFFFWNGPLWLQPRATSQVGRFAGSYLLVIPIAAGLLWASKRMSWGNLAGATLLTWAVKLLLTASIWGFVATGSGQRLQPAAVPHQRTAARGEGYRAATGPFDSGSIDAALGGRLDPAAGALAWITGAGAGQPAPAPASVDLTIKGESYQTPLVLFHLGDSLRIRNRDPELHSVSLRGAGGRALWNQPLTANADFQPVRAPRAAGVYELTCALHPKEHAWLVAVDGPYATRVDAAGHFHFEQVPIGPAEIAAAALSPEGALEEASGSTTVTQGEAASLALELAAPKEPNRP